MRTKLVIGLLLAFILLACRSCGGCEERMSECKFKESDHAILKHHPNKLEVLITDVACDCDVDYEYYNANGERKTEMWQEEYKLDATESYY